MHLAVRAPAAGGPLHALSKEYDGHPEREDLLALLSAAA